MAVETLEVTTGDACLDGHFPDEPIVPAVVLLDAVITAARKRYAARVTGVPRCRFRHPLYPGRTCSIALHTIDESHLGFVCSDPDNELAKGKLRIERDTH